MILSVPPRDFDPQEPELLDRHNTQKSLVLEELQMLETANRFLGGHHLIIECLQRLVELRPGLSLSILDLGTGLADVPRAIVSWMRERNYAVTIEAVDGNPM